MSQGETAKLEKYCQLSSRRGYTLPKSQSIPVMPAGHRHLNTPCLFTQRAPFLHGLYGRHSLTSVENRQVDQF